MQRTEAPHPRGRTDTPTTPWGPNADRYYDAHMIVPIVLLVSVRGERKFGKGRHAAGVPLEFCTREGNIREASVGRRGKLAHLIRGENSVASGLESRCLTSLHETIHRADSRPGKSMISLSCWPPNIYHAHCYLFQEVRLLLFVAAHTFPIVRARKVATQMPIMYKNTMALFHYVIRNTIAQSPRYNL